MNKNRIKLTESDLHNIIKEAVVEVLRENENLDEAGFLSSFVGQYGNRAKNKMQQVGQAAGKAIQKGAQRVGNAVQNGINTVRQGAQNVGDAVAQGYNNVKSDIQQTAQNARQDSSMKDLGKAAQNLRAIVQRYYQNGGKNDRYLNGALTNIEKFIRNYQPYFGGK
jgi:hypothetical protein